MKKYNYNYLYLILIFASMTVWILGDKGIITTYYIQIFILICINIILTTSLNLINGFCGQLSIGHAGFMAIGAYSASLFTTIIPKAYLYSFSNLNPISQWAIFLLSLVIAGFMAGLVAYFIGLPLLRLRGDYLAIGTLAFGEVIRGVAKLSDEIGTFFNDIGLKNLGELIIGINGPRGLGGIPHLTNIFWVVSLTIIIIFIIDRLVHSSYGRAWVSIREDEISAEMMGINTARYKLLAFSLAGFFAGIGGGLYAHILMFIHPDNFCFIKSVEYLVYLYLGGMSSILGSVISAAGITFLLEFMRIIGFQEWRLVIYPLILIILMLTKPEGFFKKDL
ncbi:MAG: branched-chain amino acid ABC transporter permease [bacterium]